MNRLACLALAATIGCGGTTIAPSAEQQRPTPVSGSLIEECDGEKGLTGASVLDRLDVPTSAVFRRFPADKPYGYTDPATSTRATIRIQYEGGAVRCTPAGDTSGAQMNPDIVPARVGVVVSVIFTTDDGLFEEHVQGELSSTSGASQQIDLEATIPVAELGGSYRKTAETDALGSGTPMKLSGTFSKGDLAHSEGAVDHGDRFVGLFRFDW